MARQGKSSNEEVSFSDIMLANRYRKAQNVFLNRVDRLIDWHPIPTPINKKYTKRQNAAGAPVYDVILPFKMLLLQTWYRLSDSALEERVKDSGTLSRFPGLSMEAVSADKDYAAEENRAFLAKHHLRDLSCIGRIVTAP